MVSQMEDKGYEILNVFVVNQIVKMESMVGVGTLRLYVSFLCFRL